jgi:hypothetical protein
MTKLLVGVGVVLIVVAGLWKVAVAPRFDVRFPDGWSWNMATFGTNLYADEKTGQFDDKKKFPEDDDVTVSDRVVTVSHEGVPAGSVRLDDHYLSKDPNSGTVTWDFTYHAMVDPVTGAYTANEYKDNYFLFPRNVQKTTYKIRNTSYPGLPVAFKQETTFQGLLTYEFAYTGEYDNGSAYPDYKLQPGQSIRCTDIDLRYWVEPVTGEVVKYWERCLGDAAVESASGKVLSYISRWTGESKSDSIIALSAAISNQRTQYLWLTNYLPLLLVITGIVLTGVGLFRVSRGKPGQA